MQIQIGEWSIRSFRPGDVDAIVKYGNNPNVSLQLTDRFPYPYTREDAEAWVEFARDQDQETLFAIDNRQELIGGIGLIPQDDVYSRSAMLGYWLGEPFWNRGIATLAVRAIVDWAFAELELIRIFAFVFETNTASVRVLEKTGFTLEGTMRRAVFKRGRLMDQSLYAVLIGEVEKEGEQT
ncbi:MAG: GNAT family protein [Thermoanaerobaculia bacterium]